jgi:Leucine-rich repeat (LRR) protein
VKQILILLITLYNVGFYNDNMRIDLGYFIGYVKDDNKIESLSLIDGFVRSIPSKFYDKFKHLKELDLSGNKLSEINDDFKLPNLEKLVLSDNIERKSLPENLFINCPKLKKLIFGVVLLG